MFKPCLSAACAKRTGRSAVIVTGLLFLSALAATAGAAGSGLEVLSTTDEAVVLEFRGDPLDPLRGQDGALIVTDRLLAAGPVSPFASVPGAATWIALPPGSDAAVSAKVLDDAPLPWPAEMTAAERTRIIAALPPAGATAGNACWVRNQWGMPVTYRPLSVDASGGLRYVRRAEITVRLPRLARRPLPSRPASGNDPFEESYRGLFVNYTQGRTWRRAPSPAARPAREVGFGSTPNPWVKLRVSRSGPQVVLAADLRALGLNLDGVDPLTLRLFRPRPLPLREEQDWRQAPSWMLEVPIEIRGGRNGVLSPQDSIVFLGQGPDGWYDELGVAATGPDRFFRDPYDSDVVYWLTWGGAFDGAPKRIADVDGSAVGEPFVTTVTDRVHFEQDEFWDPRQRDTANLPADQLPAWQRFWWLSLTSAPNEPEQAVRVTPLDPVTERPVRLRIRLWGDSYESESRWPDHAVRVKMNGNLVTLTDRLANGRPWDAWTRRDIDTTGTWLVPGEQDLRFNLPYHPLHYPDATRDDIVFLAWVEMDYTRLLVAHGDTIAFQSAGLLKSAQSFSVAGFATPDLTVFDTTDPFAPVRIRPVISGAGAAVTLRFRAEAGGDPPRRFVAWSNAKLVRPRLELDAPPAGGYLRARTDPERMIVITHGDFRAQAEELAQYRRTHFPGVPGRPDPISTPVAVVDVQDIYDEFSFGRVDPTALRNFLQCARELWNGGDPEAGPSYVLLVGDPHYDFRNTLGLGARVFVPTYEGCFDTALVPTVYSPQFGSDDFFAYLDGPADVGLDLYIGRFPVRTSFEAETVVEKVESYESAGADGPWKGRLTLVADDICQGTKPDDLGFLHMLQTETLALMVPPALQIDKIYLYEYGTQCAYDRKPLAAAALLARMNEGTILVNFTGHGSDSQLADERVFESAAVPGLTNADRLFLFFTASCSVGKYDFFGEGLGELMLLHRGGGAITVFSASAIAYSGGNAEMNQKYVQALFPGRSTLDARPVGEAAVTAKQTLSEPGNINSKRYVLLGDPAVRLALPHRSVEMTLEDVRSGAAMGDSLRRGVLTDLRLAVRLPDSTLDAGFDGSVQVRVYDSSPVRKMGTQVWTYLLTGAPIYRGEAEVHGGTGTLRFQVPGALRTGTRGPAGLFAYAAAADRDALGSLPDLAVPEREAPVATDHEGPRIEIHFSGDPSALPPESSFTADFFDSSGVNITGLVPSRSVVLQVEDSGTPVAVEDLADEVSFGMDYRSAQLEHSLPPGLTAGHAYELVLRASDNVGNSASTRAAFTLTGGSGGGFTLDGVYNFPNPTDGGTGFFGTLSGPADLEITIYTVSGKRIWRMREPGVIPVRLAREGIAWDGRDVDGDRPANGVYLYRMKASPTGGGPAREVTGRLVVSR